MKHLDKRERLGQDIEIKLYESLVVPTLLYNAES